MTEVEAEEKKRVLGGPMTIALLDEIAERLCTMQRFQEEERAEGVVEPIEPISVSSDVRRVIPPVKPWFSVEVANDGPDEVLALVNPEKSFDWHQVLNGETYKVDLKRSAITEVQLKCEKGKKATARLVGVR
jgi:hypothetical protein